MKYLTASFVNGLLVVVPLAVTAYSLYAVFDFLDRLVPGEDLPRGAGVAMTLGLVLAVGILATNFLTRWLFTLLGGVLERIPVVKLVYTSVRDLISAFTGERKSFDRPVLVSLGAGTDMDAIGFITRDDLSELGLTDRVAVYLPQAYAFAGAVLAVPRDRVRPLTMEAGDAMTFVVSGGVTGKKKADAASA